MSELLQWKETFTYKVKYGFFKLGEVKVQAIRDTTYQGQRFWWLQTQISSNPSLPFVGEQQNRYNSLFLEHNGKPYTVRYWRDEVSEDQPEAEKYKFDYEAHKVYVSEKGRAVDTLHLDERSTSGQLVFLYSRLFAGSGKNYKLPVYLEHKKGYIYAANSSRSQMRSYDAFKEPVKTYYSKGRADIDGPFGFRGDFEVWYLADDLRVPVEAHANVWVGNVKIRIVSYKKERRKE